MNWPDWMKNNVWQWLIGIILGVIGIVVGVLTFWSGTPAQVTSINDNKNVQVVGSPGTTVTIHEKNPEEHERQDATHLNTEKIIQMLEGKGYEDKGVLK